MCETLLKSASISDNKSIYFTPLEDERWKRFHSAGEVVCNWGAKYEEKYKHLRNMLLIASASSIKGKNASKHEFISDITAISSILAYNFDKKKGIAEAEKLLMNPSVDEVKAMWNLFE